MSQLEAVTDSTPSFVPPLKQHGFVAAHDLKPVDLDRNAQSEETCKARRLAK